MFDSSHNPRPPVAALWKPAASARARSQRKRSPLLKTWYGLIHDGGEPKPTAVNSSTTWRTDSLPKQSTTARSIGHSSALYIFDANARRAIVLLPLPDGPTMRPICQF